MGKRSTQKVFELKTGFEKKCFRIGQKCEYFETGFSHLNLGSLANWSKDLKTLLKWLKLRMCLLEHKS